MELEQFAQVLHYRCEMVCVIRQFGHEPKTRELEPGSDAAANQRIVTECAGCLPSSRRNGGGRLALGAGRREDAADERPSRWLVSEQLQRRAGIKMPDLIGIDGVPAAAFLALKQVVNARQRTTRGVRRFDVQGGTMQFPIPATFGMGSESETLYDLIRIHGCSYFPAGQISGMASRLLRR
jgi:hypothetical protein